MLSVSRAGWNYLIQTAVRSCPQSNCTSCWETTPNKTTEKQAKTRKFHNTAWGTTPNRLGAQRPTCRWNPELGPGTAWGSGWVGLTFCVLLSAFTEHARFSFRRSWWQCHRGEGYLRSYALQETQTSRNLLSYFLRVIFNNHAVAGIILVQLESIH